MARRNAYARKLATYLSPDYWWQVARLHGAAGVGSEIKRILTPDQKTPLPTPGADFVDFTDLTDDPREAIRSARDRGSVTPMLDVTVATLRRNHLGIAVDDLQSNPFTRAVADYLSGARVEYETSVLQSYYDSWKPKTLAEFVGVEADPASPLSRQLVVGDMPWDDLRTIDDLLHERDVYELERWTKFGRAPNGRHGYDYYGPTSDQLGRYRFKKHCRVAKDIAANGFESDLHVIDVQLMDGGDRWALVVRDGKHRTAALAALGVERVRVTLPWAYPIISRAEVASWAGVAGGLYTTEQALTVFDRFVAGLPPRGFPSLEPVGEYR